MKLYLIMGVEKTIKISSNTWYEGTLDLKWADGMIGACPVFTNKKKALKYAGKKFDIMTVDIKKR